MRPARIRLPAGALPSRAAVALALALPACAADPPAPGAVELRAAAVDVVRHALAGTGSDPALLALADSARAFDRTAARPAGVADALDLLHAVCVEDRAARLEAMEGLGDAALDPLLRKAALLHLEGDEEWMAARLGHDALYSRFAGFFDAIVSMGYAALQGNPFGVARPLLSGMEGAVRLPALDPGERKRAALYRRWIARHGAGAAASEEIEEVRQTLDELRQATCAEERILAQAALDRGAAEVALAHLRVAGVLSDDPDAVADLQGQVEARVAQDAERLRRNLEVAPTGSDGPARAGSILAAREGPGLRPASDPYARVERARADLARRTQRYVWTGQRESADPLLQRREVRRAMQRRLADVLAVVLWVPATLVRGVYAGLGQPVDDRPLVDALAAFAWTAPTDARRDEALAELCERLERRGEPGKALAIARAVPLDDERIRELEEQVAPADGAAEEGPQGEPIPLSALGDLATALGLAGLPLEPPRVYLTENRVLYHVRIKAGLEARESAVDAALIPRLRALAAEWAWRRRALAAPTYSELHEGTPVELYAGFGSSGVAVYPRLLPEDYVARDRRWYE